MIEKYLKQFKNEKCGSKSRAEHKPINPSQGKAWLPLIAQPKFYNADRVLGAQPIEATRIVGEGRMYLLKGKANGDIQCAKEVHQPTNSHINRQTAKMDQRIPPSFKGTKGPSIMRHGRDHKRHHKRNLPKNDAPDDQMNGAHLGCLEKQCAWIASCCFFLSTLLQKPATVTEQKQQRGYLGGFALGKLSNPSPTKNDQDQHIQEPKNMPTVKQVNHQFANETQPSSNVHKA